MNGKKIMLALFCIAGASVWSPQIWTALQNDVDPIGKHPSAEEAGLTAARKSETVLARIPTIQSLPIAKVDPQAPKLSAAMAPSTQGDAPSTEPRPSDNLSQILETLNHLSGIQNTSLSSLLETPPDWIAENTSPVNQQLETVHPIPVGSELGRRVTKQGEQEERVSSYLQDAKLSAIVIGESSSWALLGGRIVREGDVLLPEILRVQKIGKQGVTLYSPRGPIELLLPAFKVGGLPAPGMYPEAEIAPSDKVVDMGRSESSSAMEGIKN
jgi:hypothetical protein